MAIHVLNGASFSQIGASLIFREASTARSPAEAMVGCFRSGFAHAREGIVKPLLTGWRDPSLPCQAPPPRHRSRMSLLLSYGAVAI